MNKVGPGMDRLRARLGEAKLEELRQATLAEQAAARASVPKVEAQQDRKHYKDYPEVKK